MKPYLRLTRKAGWRCSSPQVVAYGDTATEAYECWLEYMVANGLIKVR